MESILANIDTDDEHEYQRTKQYNDLVCPGSEDDNGDDDSGDDDSDDECSGANWGLLWENLEGKIQGGNCVVGGEIWAENCDCSDPKNYNYAEGRF